MELFIFKHSVFDFSRAKVRCNGKSLDKYGLACVLAEIRPSYCWRIIYDAFSYSELKDTLRIYLSTSN